MVSTKTLHLPKPTVAMKKSIEDRDHSHFFNATLQEKTKLYLFDDFDDKDWKGLDKVNSAILLFEL